MKLDLFRQDLQDYQDFFGLVWLYPVNPVDPVRKWKVHAGVSFSIRPTVFLAGGRAEPPNLGKVFSDSIMIVNYLTLRQLIVQPFT